MMSGAEYHDAAMARAYAELCMEVDLEQAMCKLTDQRVYDLTRWLVMQGVSSGVPALVSGLLEVEATKRFMKLMEENVGGAR